MEIYSHIDRKFSNNELEYEAIIMELKVLVCIIKVHDHLQVVTPQYF